MEKRKTLIITVLCVLVGIMAVGYAVLAQQLNIKGRASIDSTWRVEITKITEKDQLGGASSKEVPNYTATTANFNVGLVQPGDTISYEVEISNLGTLNAKVDSINVVMDENDAIKYTVSGVTEGDKLAAGSKTTLTVKVEYNGSASLNPDNKEKSITVTINYIQDISGGQTAYDYIIGDKVEFSGSTWRVLKNSSKNDDYVTLLKETVLTTEELGSYASDKGNGSIHFDNSSECFNDMTKCNYDYDQSYIKDFFDTTYINTIGQDKLKIVDGYKIRLITFDEIMGDLGAEYINKASFLLGSLDNVPRWIYEDFIVGTEEYTYYYTMTTTVNPGYPSLWFISNHADVVSSNIGDATVRPVINLLKSSL